MYTRIPNTLIRQASVHLKKGGVIAYATESCFGFGVNPKNPRAIRRLIRLKKRELHKGLIVIGSQIEQFHRLIRPLALSEYTYLQNHWPAAKTYLVHSRSGTFPLLRGIQKKKIAIRIPDHAQARFLCQQIHSPLVSTSANIAHKKTCRTMREIKRQFPRQVLMIPGRVGRYKQSSQILDLSTLQRLR